MYNLPEYSQCPKDTKKVSYVGVQCQNTHQDSQNPPKPHVLDVLDLPDLPDGDQKSCTPFQSPHNVPRIPERYHMWGCHDKIPIKTAKILHNPMFWMFLTFLIFLMVSKSPVHPSRVLPTSQGFQKGIICGGKMIKNLYSDGHLMADYA